MLQFVLLPNRCCLHSKLNQMQRIMYRRQLHFQKCCKCCCCCCYCCCRLTSLAGSVELPGQFTAKLLDKTVAHKAAGMAATQLVMCLLQHTVRLHTQRLHRLNRLHLCMGNTQQAQSHTRTHTHKYVLYACFVMNVCVCRDFIVAIEIEKC